MPCTLVNWSAETAAHSSPIYSSTAINKEQVWVVGSHMKFSEVGYKDSNSKAWLLLVQAIYSDLIFWSAAKKFKKIFRARLVPSAFHSTTVTNIGKLPENTITAFMYLAVLCVASVSSVLQCFFLNFHKYSNTMEKKENNHSLSRKKLSLSHKNWQRNW